MPLLHCTKCSHEWEGTILDRCDWCNASGKVLETQTPLEKMLSDDFLKKMREIDAVRRKNWAEARNIILD